MPDKKVNLELPVGDNAFRLMALFKNQARSDGWSYDEIDAVLDEAKAGDYDHLVETLESHCV